VALFFLQIQGSGRVQMPDGQTLYIGYADQNGHPYVAIGNKLIEIGALKADEVNLQSIRVWLAAHPDGAEAVLNSNPSYVFFAVRDAQLPGPLGALNVPLLPERAVAVDPAFVPLGAPVWLDTELPGSESKPYRRLTFAQDTGGAIKGAARADLFFGYGAEAERLAGQMKQRGRMYVFLPAMRMDAQVSREAGSR
jgi:membrane-bound lytic murein transglycosylase A